MRYTDWSKETNQVPLQTTKTLTNHSIPDWEVSSITPLKDTLSVDIYLPTFWPNGPEIDHSAPTLTLDDLLPDIGGTAFACFDKHDRPHAGDTVRLLWTPPVSDINGWSEQPSEIALSYLLTANVSSEATLVSLSDGNRHPILQEKYRYALRILARERLLPALKNFPADANPWTLPVTATAQGITQLWDEVHWCGKATVEGLIYLAATTSEASMEMLLDKEDENLIGLFSMHFNPGGSNFCLGRQRLTSIEQNVMRRAIDRAQPLADSQAPYIMTGRAQG